MKKKIIYPIIGIISGLLNGALGTGGGTVVVSALERLLGVEPHKAHATAIAIILPITIVSSIFYLKHGLLDFHATIIIAAAGMVGGFIGAKLLNIVPTKVVKMMFGASMVLLGIRMLWR